MSRHERPGSGPEFNAQYDQLMQRYQEALGIIVDDHNRTSEQIAQDHEENLEYWTQDPATKNAEVNFPKTLSIPGDRVAKDTQNTAKSVDSVFEASSRDFSGILSPEDRLVLTKAQEKAGLYGPESSFVSNTINAASSRQAQSAMEAALDKLVWKKAQEKAGLYGPESSFVSNTINAASSRQAQSAMEAALDKLVWKKAQEKAGLYGPESSFVSNTINAASSRQAQSAMEAALDKLVWKKAQEKAGLYGPESSFVSNTINAASSRQAQSAMENLLEKTRQTRETYTPPRSSPFDEYDMPDFEDILRNYGSTYRGARARGGAQSGGQQRPRSNGGQQHRQQPPPRTHEAPRRPNIDAETENIIRAAVSNGRGERWLLNEDRAAIRKVINTVKNARENAQKDGKEITDKQIYIRYRRLVDKPETEAKPEDLLRSFKILQALMGGSPSGKLPF